MNNKNFLCNPFYLKLIFQNNIISKIILYLNVFESDIKIQDALFIQMEITVQQLQ